jgi:hypothetical protein
MAFGLAKDPGRLASGVVLIICGIGQLTHAFTFNLPLTLVVAGGLFIMEALRW